MPRSCSKCRFCLGDLRYQYVCFSLWNVVLGIEIWLMRKVQFSSVAQSCLTLCDPMNRSTPGLPVCHQLQEFTQTHVHWVGDAIQPSHPLLSPSPPAPNPSQHQGLFQWVSSSHDEEGRGRIIKNILQKVIFEMFWDFVCLRNDLISLEP